MFPMNQLINHLFQNTTTGSAEQISKFTTLVHGCLNYKPDKAPTTEYINFTRACLDQIVAYSVRSDVIINETDHDHQTRRHTAL